MKKLKTVLISASFCFLFVFGAILSVNATQESHQDDLPWWGWHKYDCPEGSAGYICIYTNNNAPECPKDIKTPGPGDVTRYYNCTEK